VFAAITSVIVATPGMTRFNKMKATATDTKVEEVVRRKPLNLKRLPTRGVSEQIARAYLSGETIHLPIAQDYLEHEAVAHSREEDKS
jgi:hypothetical protein